MSNETAGDDRTELGDYVGALLDKIIEEKQPGDEAGPSTGSVPLAEAESRPEAELPAEAQSSTETRTSTDPDDPVPDEWSVRTIVVTMVPLLALLSVLQMISGTVLETFEETLLVNPSLLVLVPVQIGTAGNLGSIMCSRLSTQLYLGTLEFRWDNPNVRADVGAILLLGFTVFVLVGLAAWAIGTALGGSLTLAQVMTISLGSGMLLAGFVVVVSILSVHLSYRAGLNPDDTTIPIVTNVSDITGVIILFVVTSLVL